METQPMTIARALDLFLGAMAGVLSNQTVTWYRGRLHPLVEFVGGDRVLSTLTIEDLRRWRASLTERKTRYMNCQYRREVPGGLSRFTLQSHVRAVRAFFRWCVEEELLAVNPARRLESPSLPDNPRKGDEITGLPHAGNDFHVFHAGPALAGQLTGSVGNRLDLDDIGAIGQVSAVWFRRRERQHDHFGRLGAELWKRKFRDLPRFSLRHGQAPFDFLRTNLFSKRSRSRGQCAVAVNLSIKRMTNQAASF